MEYTLDKKRLDEVTRIMFERGFQCGYEFGKSESWILTGKDLPQTQEPVEVTVLLPDGTSRVAQSKYVDGRWTIRSGKVTAWRPAPKPYEEDITHSF